MEARKPVEFVLSVTAEIFAALFLITGLLSLHEGLFHYFYLMPGISFTIDTAIFFGCVYVAFIFPNFREKSIWVLGLIWGFAELSWNATASFFYIGVSFPTPYLIAVFGFFLLSAFMLRDEEKRWLLGIFLVPAIFVYLPLTVNLNLPGIAAWNLDYLLVTITVFYMVRFRASAPS